MKTFSIKQSEIKKNWILADAEGKILGRFAAKIAQLLKGKHKPTYTPHMDMGDCVVIINAEKIKLTGSKEKNKTYFSHSGYPGSTSFADIEQVRRTYPERILESAIKGMLPKNRLGRKMMTHLRIYAGSEHPHAAQNPTVLDK